MVAKGALKKTAGVKVPSKTPEQLKEEAFKEMGEKASNEKYLNQSYPKESMVEIPGTVFADFINMISEARRIMSQVQNNMRAEYSALDVILDRSDNLTLTFMDLHFKHVDNGVTVKSEELLKNEDAKSN